MSRFSMPNVSIVLVVLFHPILGPRDTEIVLQHIIGPRVSHSMEKFYTKKLLRVMGCIALRAVNCQVTPDLNPSIQAFNSL